MLTFFEFKNKVNRASNRKVVGIEVVRLYEDYKVTLKAEKKNFIKDKLLALKDILIQAFTVANLFTLLVLIVSEDSLFNWKLVAVMVFNLVYLLIVAYKNKLFD